jgi:hypothetical protein
LTIDEAADFAPAWAADGAAFYFIRERARVSTLYRMRADGGDEARIMILPSFAADLRAYPQPPAPISAAQPPITATVTPGSPAATPAPTDESETAAHAAPAKKATGALKVGRIVVGIILLLQGLLLLVFFYHEYDEYEDFPLMTSLMAILGVGGIGLAFTPVGEWVYDPCQRLLEAGAGGILVMVIVSALLGVLGSVPVATFDWFEEVFGELVGQDAARLIVLALVGVAVPLFFMFYALASVVFLDDQLLWWGVLPGLITYNALSADKVLEEMRYW